MNSVAAKAEDDLKKVLEVSTGCLRPLRSFLSVDSCATVCGTSPLLLRSAKLRHDICQLHVLPQKEQRGWVRSLPRSSEDRHFAVVVGSRNSCVPNGWAIVDSMREVCNLLKARHRPIGSGSSNRAMGQECTQGMAPCEQAQQ